ncbi:MAG: 2-octaprenyl-6-methoxyphenyl hydroxylase [Gammaproteobacteria bacterium]|nr:2-octaprenyl-6-methoxyphenyl hydroxylase [Gammaproteobacteria bacterium]MDH3769297.1 2-octaprenyl-6-methoxyphenyl hydroxylase [Gammaproteobacteria bacterium]
MTTDILIVGGGMVGASLAAALGPLSYSVTVVEASPPRDPGQPSYDDRATALSWGSRRILETLGLWEELEPAATAIHDIHVSDRGQFGVTRLSHREQNVPALGYVVENRALGKVLWRAMEQARTDVLCPASVESVTTVAEHADVTARHEDGTVSRCRARLLVVADGARSATRDMLGADSTVTDYMQTALITNITPERFHEHVAYERFTATGPLALLPLSNGRCSVVWTLSPQRAAEVGNMDDKSFLAALQNEFGHRLGRFQKVGSRHSYPLSLVQATQITGQRNVLIGNAAHGLHPVAGQGFNLGLRDVATLADVIADATDPGSASTLGCYGQWRKEDHRRVISFTDGLVRLFTSDLPPLRLARGAGLIALDLLAAPRSILARQSMGVSGRLPRLARGVPLR